MTEAEWLASHDLYTMLEFLHRKVAGRELRLFAAACGRRIWEQYSSPLSRRTVELAEDVAEGLSSTDDLYSAGRDARAFAESDEGRLTETGCAAAYAAARVAPDYLEEAAVWSATSVAQCVRDTFYWVAYETAEASGSGRSECEQAGDAAGAAADIANAELLRDIIGNPFHRVVLASPCRTSALLFLAQAAYEERILPLGHLENARLAVLSDALEEAGCSDAEILAHLRSPGPHVRGCWALDLILGRS